MALVIALMLVATSALGTITTVHVSASASHGPTDILVCEPQSNPNSSQQIWDDGNTHTDGPPDQVATPLWCVSDFSGGHAPAPSDTSGCQTGGAGAVTIDSTSRGFDWVC